MRLKQRFVTVETRWLGRQLLLLLRLTLLATSSLLAATVLNLLDPLIIKWIIDVALSKRSIRLLLCGTLAFGAAYIGQLTFSYAAYLLSCAISQKLIFRLRVALIRCLQLFSAGYYDNTSVGEIMFRVEQDVDQIGEFGRDVLPTIIRMAIVSVMVVLTMGVLNLQLAVMILPLLPVFYLSQHRYLKRLTLAAEATQQQMGCISSFLHEYILGMPQLQLLNRAGTHGRQFARSLAVGAKLHMAQRVLEVRFSAEAMLVIVVGNTLILGYGGYGVIHNRLSLGGLVAFYSYVSRLFEPMSVAVDLQSRLQRVRASVRRIVAILNNEAVSTSNRTPRTRPTTASGTTLEFSGVCFSYRYDRPVLDGVSFRASRGEKIALVGASGCGKSTIGHLATRLYSPKAGSILIDGVDLQDLGQRNLRSIVTVVPQEPILFNATLRENLLYGRPSATSRDLERALSLACLHDVIRKLPQRLDEPLGPMGRKLSGGERKRVALARAVLQSPQILILDEVTNGLDRPTATSLLAALDTFRREKTLILISHKLSAIAWADKIMVLDHGKILDEGMHGDLLSRCELYRLLYHGLSRKASDREEVGAFEP